MQVTRKKTCYSGLAIVETAIVFPILLLITLGVIHFAWLFLKAHQITSAARDGARLAALEGANWGEVQAHILDSLQAVGISGCTVAYSVQSVAGHSCVTVQITVPGANVAILNLSGFGVLTPEYLRGAVTMAMEGS
jgi:Flp pilus assembly protein TadG